MNKRIFIFTLTIFFYFNLFSQTDADSIKPTPLVIIKMKNRVEYKGQVLKNDNDTIVFKTKKKEINLIASNILSIDTINYVGKYEFANPHDTRYFLGPTGIPLKQWKGFVQTTSFVSLGVTKNISIGGGLDYLLKQLDDTPLYYLNVKVGFNISKYIHIGGGFLGFGYKDINVNRLGYAVLTLGSSEANLSFGAGYGLIVGELTKNLPMMISGTLRVSNRLAFVSENYVYPTQSVDKKYFGVHGFRILSKQNAFDIGVAVIPELGKYLPLPLVPYVGFARVF